MSRQTKSAHRYEPAGAITSTTGRLSSLRSRSTLSRLSKPANTSAHALTCIHFAASFPRNTSGVRGQRPRWCSTHRPHHREARSALTKETPLACLLRRSSRARAKAPRREAPARPGSEETQAKPGRALPLPSAELPRPLRRSELTVIVLLTLASPPLAGRPLSSNVAA